MSKIQRLLALEAALCACEGIIPPENELRAFVERELGPTINDLPFGVFLEAQLDAVTKLAQNPQVFGC